MDRSRIEESKRFGNLSEKMGSYLYVGTLIYRISFSPHHFSIRFPISIKKFSSNDLILNVEVESCCDMWARKHPKNLGKVSGGENPSHGLINPPPVFKL
jgi:hypothetical protein